MSEKKLKTEIRLWGGKAYERLLNRALRRLDDDFRAWREARIDAFELSGRIHKFHDGISRDLYVLAGHMHGRTILLEAINQEEIRPDELGPELWESLRPHVESLARLKKGLCGDTLPEEDKI